MKITVLVLVLLASGLGHATSVCDRTPEVKSIIEKTLKKDCGAIHADDLEKITALIFELEESQTITSLTATDFEGLSSLKNLGIYDAPRLVAIPSDLLKGLANLTRLTLQANLQEIPPGFLSGLTKLEGLDLTGNGLKKIEPNTFNDLRALRFLSLAYNQLTELDAAVFQNLTNLDMLVLHNNQFENLPAGIFGNNPLHVLALQNNKFKTYPSVAIQDLDQLGLLILTGNKLVTIPSRAFANNARIESLILDDNVDIIDIPEDVFAPEVFSARATVSFANNHLSKSTHDMLRRQLGARFLE